MTIAREIVTKYNHTPAKPTGGRLDLLDIRLLREILQGRTAFPLSPDFRKSFRMIARTIGIDEETVRRRVKRLEQIGFVTGWDVILNPSVLGMGESVVVFDVPPETSKAELVARLRLVPGVWLIVNFYGSFLGIVFRYEGDAEKKRIVALAQTLSNAPGIILGETAWPPCTTKLAKMDWEIIASLCRNPRKSYTEVSQDLAISSRTVQRRLERLIGKAVLFSLAAIDPKALDGTLLANLTLGCNRSEASEVRGRVVARLDELIWHVFLTIPTTENALQYTNFNLGLPNISKAHEISEWARTQAGVKVCRLDFCEEYITLFDTIDEPLQRKLAKTELARL